MVTLIWPRLHVLDCRSDLHFVVLIEVSSSLRKTKKLLFSPLLISWKRRQGFQAIGCQVKSARDTHLLGRVIGLAAFFGHFLPLMWEHSWYKQEAWGGSEPPGLQAVSRSAVCTRLERRRWCGHRGTALLESFPVKLFEWGILKVKECLWQEKEAEVSWHTWTKDFCEPWPAFLMSLFPAMAAAASRCAVARCAANCFGWHDDLFVVQVHFHNCSKEWRNKETLLLKWRKKGQNQ